VPAAAKAPPPGEGELVTISQLEEWAQVRWVSRDRGRTGLQRKSLFAAVAQ
jgi:hypothetical protein